MTEFRNPADEEIKQLLEKTRDIAIVGLSPKPGRPSYFVACEMQKAGYRIIPVRPATEEVLGEKAYASLGDIGKPLQLVNVFLNPSRLDAIIDSCIELSVPAIWLQEGVVNETAALRAQQAGIMVIMDLCIYKEYERLLKS